MGINWYPKIKIIETAKIRQLEMEVNKFIKDKVVKSIQFSQDMFWYRAIIFYDERGEEE